MMISKFSILNFKGIKETTINLSDGTPGNVVTLIGLNESGKTTILEAISHFGTEDKQTAKLVSTVQKKSSLPDIIPRNRKAAFTDDICISATVIVADEDIVYAAGKALSSHGMIVDISSFPREFTIERTFEFIDSALKHAFVGWNVEFKARKKNQKKTTIYNGSDEEPEESKKVWLTVVEAIEERIPQIVYFPTFMFQFPERIYLENDANETNTYYRQVIQDVLDSHGRGLDIRKHIIERIARMRDKSSTPAMFAPFFSGTDEKKQIDAVCQEAAGQISRVVFGSWNEILARDTKGKRVHIDWGIDGEKDNTPYLEIYIVEGQSKYSIAERSMGFRWFFSFLLFTQFRKNRKGMGANIFLFDEPASNLHSKAQMKLLDSFAQIATENTYIIYSTHSHYLVNPIWLNKAYIVRNMAINYEKYDDDYYSSSETNVKAIRYKTFLGQNPTSTTYFQPALDALDVGFSPLRQSSKAIVIEGINDYYPFVYMFRRVPRSVSPDFFPANGAGDLRNVISLFRGWGVDFRIILDDDKAGQQGRKKHLEECLVSENDIRTIGDLNSNLSGGSLERAYCEPLRKLVSDYFSVTELKKRHFSLYFQHLLATKASISVPETEAAFAPLIEWVVAQFSD